MLHDIVFIYLQSTQNTVPLGMGDILITTTVVIDDPNVVDIGGPVISGPYSPPHIPVTPPETLDGGGDIPSPTADSGTSTEGNNTSDDGLAPAEGDQKSAGEKGSENNGN